MINKDDYKQFEGKMSRTISVLEEELATVRAGRANPAILDKITVEYYGTETPHTARTMLYGSLTPNT